MSTLVEIIKVLILMYGHGLVVAIALFFLNTLIVSSTILLGLQADMLSFFGLLFRLIFFLIENVEVICSCFVELIMMFLNGINLGVKNKLLTFDIAMLLLLLL